MIRPGPNMISFLFRDLRNYRPIRRSMCQLACFLPAFLLMCSFVVHSFFVTVPFFPLLLSFFVNFNTLTCLFCSKQLYFEELFTYLFAAIYRVSTFEQRVSKTIWKIDTKKTRVWLVLSICQKVKNNVNYSQFLQHIPTLQQTLTWSESFWFCI